MLLSWCCFPVQEAAAQCLAGTCQEGWGKLQTSEGIYDGNFRKGLYEGRGNFFYPDGRFCEATWSAGQPKGSAILYDAQGVGMEVIWRNNQWQPLEPPVTTTCISGDCFSGLGTSRDSRGRQYRGDFREGRFEGYGVLTYPNGDRYEGEFKRGLPQGQGRLVKRNGHIEAGKWEQGRPLDLKARVWALVVGIGAYEQVPSLEFTSVDAKRFYEFLRSPEGGKVPERQMRLLLNEEASLANLQNALAEVFEQADTSDLIIFYFAGHGLEGGLVPVDYDTLKNNLLQHSTIHSLMMDSKAKHRLCLADACHSGSYGIAYQAFKEQGYQKPNAATRSMASTREQLARFYQGLRRAKSGLAIILSSAAEEISLEASNLRQGVFTYFLIQGLKGGADTDKDASITIDELFNYLQAKVQHFTFGFQNPMIFGDYDKKMPVAVLPKQ